MGCSITTAALSPTDIGHPVSRNRQFSVCTLRDTVSLVTSWRDFFDTFGRKVIAPQKFLFEAPLRYVLQVKCDKARQHGWHARADGAEPPVDCCLSASAKRHLVQYGAVKARQLTKLHVAICP